MNFDYLNSIPEMTQLHKICTNAESFALDSPDISIGESRKASEYIVKLIYGSAIGKNSFGLSFFEILQDMDLIAFINNEEIMETIHFIRITGNKAVHEGNATSEESVKCIEKLHFVVGEFCILLNLISEYSAFSPNFKSGKTIIETDTEVSPELIAYFSSRLSGIKNYPKGRQIIDVHKCTHNNPTSEKKIDSAANSKTAFYQFAEKIASLIGNDDISVDYNKLTIIINKDTTPVIIAVKTGCSVLGTRQANGNWNILPGITHIVYAPNLTADLPIEEQLIVMTSEEFLDLWESLGLVRYKVSTAALRRYHEMFGEDFKPTSKEHGDNMSIQSFLNSKKKMNLVMDKLYEYPKLSQGGYDILLKSIK